MTLTRTKPWTNIIPLLITVVFLAPVIIGLWGTWLPSLGYVPVLGLTDLNLQPWQQLHNYPGFYSALTRTVTTGISASLLSLMLLFVLLIGLYPSKLFGKLERFLSPILSVPHAAFAIGLGFLITPSGWILRSLEATTGLFPQPPVWTTFQDPLGLSFILALTAKELPFLVFMALAVLPTLNVNKTLLLANSLGHSRRYAWLNLIIPQLYKQIKLPFLAVIAYSLTVVDIAIIAGPTTPPTLAVLVTQLFNDPNLTLRTVGAAGATCLLLIVLICLTLTHLFERPARQLRNAAISQGAANQKSFSLEKPMALATCLSLGLIYIGALLLTFVWSFTQRWRYPDLFPAQWSTRSWQRVLNRIEEPFVTTFGLAMCSAAISLTLVILLLENEHKNTKIRPSFNVQTFLWLIYLPLLIPQIAFIFGFQIALIQFQFDGTFIALLWSHLVFVLPYVYLTLSGPYRKFDVRYSWQATALTQNTYTAFWKIKLSLLLRPLLYAFATGFSVSIAQYLPTLFIGAGKFSTVTTEAVAMAAGSDFRMMAVLAMLQQLLPFLIFLLATAVPALLFRHRLAMKQG